LHGPHGGHAGRRGPHREPALAQDDRQQLAHGRIVVHDQHVPDLTHVGTIGRGIRELEGPAQPPATAGTIDTVWPSATGESRPWRKRTSSSATNTFTNRRRRPCSSNSRPWNPGWAASRAPRTSPTVLPSTLTSDAPPARDRSWVGMRTTAVAKRANSSGQASIGTAAAKASS